MNIKFGIDFGTTNTVVSIANKTGKLIDSFSIPTILYIPQEKSGIKNIYIGDTAVDEYHKNGTGRYIHSIKRSLSDTSFENTIINKTLVTLEDLISLFMLEIKKIIEEKWCLTPKEIMLGRPVKFSDIKKEDDLANYRLLEGFKLAGFHNITQLQEPIAAAFGLRSLINSNDNRVLVVDIGGGTSDYTIVDIDHTKDEKNQFLIRSTDGINIGGDNFDEDIMFAKIAPLVGLNETYSSFKKNLPLPIHLFKDLCRWNHIYRHDRVKLKEDFQDYLYGSSNKVMIKKLYHIIYNRLSSRILEKVKSAKHKLSTRPSAFILFNEADLNLKTGVTLNQMNSILEPSLQSLTDRLDQYTTEDREKIDKVIVTGGSSQNKKLQEKVSALYPNAEIIIDPNFYNSISNGLALY